MLLANHQKLHHKFFEFYIQSGQYTIKKDLQKQLCHRNQIQKTEQIQEISID